MRIKFKTDGNWEEVESVEDWLSDVLDSTTDGAYFHIEGDDKTYQAIQIITDAWVEV